MCAKFQFSPFLCVMIILCLHFPSFFLARLIQLFLFSGAYTHNYSRHQQHQLKTNRIATFTISSIKSKLRAIATATKTRSTQFLGQSLCSSRFRNFTHIDPRLLGRLRTLKSKPIRSLWRHTNFSTCFNI